MQGDRAINRRSVVESCALGSLARCASEVTGRAGQMRARANWSSYLIEM
jgi:hypothetical protein